MVQLQSLFAFIGVGFAARVSELADEDSKVAEVVAAKASDTEVNYDTQQGLATTRKGKIQVGPGDGHKCLDVANNDIDTNGANIFAATCRPGDIGQSWRHTAGGSLKNARSGKCIDIKDNRCDNNQNLILWNCQGSANQRWIVHDNQITSTKCPDMCMNVARKDDDGINNIRMFSCKGWDSQRMVFTTPTTTPTPTPAPITEGLIKVGGDGHRCLSVENQVYSDGANIIAARCHDGDPGQQWKFDGGHLKHVLSGRCIDIYDKKCRNNQNLILYRCHHISDSNQLWESQQDGTIKSTDPWCNHKCMDVAEHTQNKNVVLYDCKGTLNQKMIMR